ncbi:hypothetical protein K9U39_12805 [Rhodoblastus acidophilus]|uniref:Uncharacterized protein n=1 Tax=Candidatus Rhodoblastus alkanivorans TaxID=2954117 RepID=A0ABS9Z9W8_9HYPH|nr:hypothetical protein [Candidatus Rhodoblastus alkanivorans]MCI4677136.1 hypothetical protein [Candidatus Rhodoblastus alkanivorans]MCI4684489.1 hypothetical protein [Candidatus Rhodoblastus alkanivorans]MDI4641810.1 hypothetical protein [Rhodoblastus acidophilus]
MFLERFKQSAPFVQFATNMGGSVWTCLFFDVSKATSQAYFESTKAKQVAGPARRERGAFRSRNVCRLRGEDDLSGCAN